MVNFHAGERITLLPIFYTQRLDRESIIVGEHFLL